MYDTGRVLSIPEKKMETRLSKIRIFVDQWLHCTLEIICSSIFHCMPNVWLYIRVGLNHNYKNSGHHAWCRNQYVEKDSKIFLVFGNFGNIVYPKASFSSSFLFSHIFSQSCTHHILYKVLKVRNEHQVCSWGRPFQVTRPLEKYSSHWLILNHTRGYPRPRPRPAKFGLETGLDYISEFIDLLIHKSEIMQFSPE